MDERDRLRAGIRLALGFIADNRQDQARRMGVSLYTLGRWLAGVAEPRPENIARLSRQSGMTEEAIRAGRLSAN